jgi:hypothetical protein
MPSADVYLQKFGVGLFYQGLAVKSTSCLGFIGFYRFCMYVCVCMCACVRAYVRMYILICFVCFVGPVQWRLVLHIRRTISSRVLVPLGQCSQVFLIQVFRGRRWSRPDQRHMIHRHRVRHPIILAVTGDTSYDQILVLGYRIC